MNTKNLLDQFRPENLAWFQFVAVVSAIVFIISLLYPIPWIKNKHVALFSSGLCLFAVVEWSQWKGYWEKRRARTGIIYEPYLEKESRYYHKILKIIALFLIVIPFLELIFGINLIPFLRENSYT